MSHEKRSKRVSSAPIHQPKSTHIAFLHLTKRIIAVSSSIAVSLTLASLHYNWGLVGLWSSMIFAYFGLRILAHIRRCT